MTKRTLYHHFPSKDALVAAYLRRRDPATRERFRAAAESPAEPEATVLAVFDHIARWATEGYRGCAFLNAVAECPDDANVRAATIEHKDAIEQWFRQQLAGVSDPADAAAMLMILYDGALTRASVYRNAAPANAARAAAVVLLASLT